MNAHITKELGVMHSIFADNEQRSALKNLPLPQSQQKTTIQTGVGKCGYTHDVLYKYIYLRI